jgi:pimeloyl-ACP methyl ester carboxylesterase
MTGAPVPLVCDRVGAGRPLWVLHGMDGTLFADRFLTALAADHEVIVPRCPGWGGEDLPNWLRTVDELSYVYLDELERVSGGTACDAVGLSFGAWLLMAMATKNPSLFASLVLVSPLGVKLSDRTTRQFADVFAWSLDERAAALYATPPAGGIAALDDEARCRLAHAQEGVARFGWEPYLHDPAMRHRLHRVQCSTLIVHGREDRFVQTGDYHEQLATCLGGPVEVCVAERAGHRVEEEQPDWLAATVGAFVRARA